MRAPLRKSVFPAATAVFLGALALRLTLLFALPHYLLIPPMEMERVARSFAATGELANPYATPTGPTAHVLPLYPVLLGAIYRIWGTGHAGLVAQGVWGSTLSALRCAFLYPLTLFMGLSRRIALLSAILSAIYIPAFSTDVRGGWEASLAALFLMGIAYLAMRLIYGRELQFSTAVLYGLAVGLSTLLSATLLIVAGGFLAVGAWTFRRSLPRYLAWSGIVLSMVVLCLAPWAWRNHQQLGKTVWLRSNLGLELWQAYRSGAGIGAFDTDSNIGPALNPAASEQVGAMGEVRYHEMLKREALAWIRSHPGVALHLTLDHVLYFWLPPSPALLFRLIRVLLTIVAACGLFLLLRRRMVAGYIIAAIWVFFPLVYYIVYWSSRYRYPMEWTLVVTAAVAISAGAELLPRTISRTRRAPL